MVMPYYEGDLEFGAVFGGRPDPIYRFIYGFDRRTSEDLLKGWRGLYQQTRDYLFAKLAEEGIDVPENLRDIPAPPVRQVNPWALLSLHDIASEQDVPIGELFERITLRSRLAYRPAFGFFSLAMAVNFTWHMLLIAYTESNFLLQLPAVGSDLEIATVTRQRGFERRYRDEPSIELRES
jgi:hypothetical protein